tara:strand:+ start:691 stop:1239 length:549 start_codon:yes stop_codon:yes gene_type:complete
MAVMEAIATTHLEDDATLVTFSSIPATYEHLQLRMSVRSTKVSTHGYENGRLVINGDGDAAANNYSWHAMTGGASSVGTAIAAAADRTYSMWLTNTATQDYGFMVVDIYDYASTNKNTSFTWSSVTNVGVGNSGGDSGQPQVMWGGGMWKSTAAVNSVGYGPYSTHDLVRGSSLSLYGVNSS